METNQVPGNLYDYYRSNPSMFEERVDGRKRAVGFVLSAVCVLLLVVPSVIPVGDLVVRVIAAAGLLYFGYSAFFGSKDFYSLGGGKINDLAVKKFADPSTLDECGRIIAMFEEDDFAGLAAEADANDRPLQLYLHEDAAGKTFYLQQMWHFSASDFRGITEVKALKEPQYSKYYPALKRIKST
ncbi:MAG: hypothetical protein LBI58_03335 [Tannerellaceae bacterium]|jgi:hypothetical protein|nr:hypothetical protein [Tannerellaceae bacterium]